MSDFTDQWQTITKLYGCTKAIQLLAEELEVDHDHKSFLQPILEQRHALDHICRSMDKIYGKEDGLCDPDNDYASKNLDKAIGHMYRSFFDAADWFCIVMREKIHNLLKPYDNECISAAIPRYYSEFRPDIEKITIEIAKIRKDKDVGTCSAVTEEVSNYNNVLDRLSDIYKQISAGVPSLNEHKKRQKRSELKKYLCQVGIAVVVAFILGVLAAIGIINR